jgi:hypothetical protein
VRVTNGRRLVVVGGVVVAALAVAAAVVWALAWVGGSDSTPADGGETPGPGASATVAGSPTVTPSATFVGTLNGIAIDPGWRGRTPFEVCPEVGIEPVSPVELLQGTVAGQDRLRVDPALMPGGVAQAEAPEAFACRSHLVDLTLKFTVEPGTADANPGGGTVFVRRALGKEPLQHGAPAERWSATTIGRHPAVVLRAVVEQEGRQFGECLAAFYDAETDVLTTVVAVAANGAFCVRVAESVARGDPPVIRRDGRFAPIQLEETVFAYPIVDEFGTKGIEIFETATEASVKWIPRRPTVIFQGHGEYDRATGGTVYDRGWNEMAGYLGQTDRLARLAAGLPYYDPGEAPPTGPPPARPPGPGCSAPQCPTPTPPPTRP